MKDTVEIVYQQGGMMEFAETGIYPEYLTVYSPKWKKRWRKSISGEKKQGSLYVGKQLVYTYKCDEEREEKMPEIRDAEGKLVEISSYSHIMAD